MSKNGPVDREKIYDQIAKDTGLPRSKVKKAAKFQFTFTGKVMRQGKFNAVRLPYFGKFFVKEGRVEYLEEAKRKKEAKKAQEEDE